MLLKAWQTVWPLLLNRLYFEFAWLYDWASRLVSAGHWRSWQRAVLPFIDDIAAPGWPVRVLEVGHGTGNTLIDLCELPVDVVGLDKSWAMSQRAREQLAHAGRALAVPLVAGQAETLPFASQAFAALVAVFPTRYVVEPTTVSEFYRVLRPGGLVVIGQTASLTSQALPDRLARAALSLAQRSQTWPARLEAIYMAQGFTVGHEQVRLARSVVTIVLARKPRPRPSTTVD